MVIDPRWNEYVSILFNWQNGHRANALISAVRATIRDDEFWQQCKKFEHMVKLVIKALQVFDRCTPAMAKV
jgi:queuine/archaeosine tRNA-ribosyltransferase